MTKTAQIAAVAANFKYLKRKVSLKVFGIVFFVFVLNICIYVNMFICMYKL